MVTKYCSFAVVISFLLASQATATDGLVSSWKFDENQACTINDETSLNNGTLKPNCTSNSPRWVSGRGSALEFDGYDDYVEIPDSSSLDITDNITIQVAVYPKISNYWDRIIVKSTEDGDGTYMMYGLYFYDQTTRMGFIMTVNGEEARLQCGGSIPLNQWTLITATYDGQMQKLYYNDTLACERSQTGNIDTNDMPLHIGVDLPRDIEYFNGTIDEVSIYNKALSEAEVGDKVNTLFDLNTSIQINEFLSHPSTGELEWIELYNNESFDVNISGWKLDDVDGGGSTPYTIPNGTVIGSRGFLVFYSNTTGIDLDDISDSVRLLNPIDSVVDSYSYSITLEGISYGRTTEGGSSWTTYVNPTPGSINNPYQITLSAGWNLMSIPLII